MRPVTFAQARRAIVRLYGRHPEIRSFVYQDVVYTPETRDKVLATCRLGAASSNAREKETTRVFGCAPLIFFFYNFGRQKSVPESIEVARKLFWPRKTNRPLGLERRRLDVPGGQASKKTGLLLRAFV
jgi:hypothetical protein